MALGILPMMCEATFILLNSGNLVIYLHGQCFDTSTIVWNAFSLLGASALLGALLKAVYFGMLVAN